MQYQKISPKLLLAFKDYNDGGTPALARHKKTIGVISSEASPKPARAVVFLHCNDRASFRAFAKKGIHVNQARGKLRTAIVPLNALKSLSEHKGVKRIVPAKKLRPRMDVAPAKTNVAAFKTSSGLSGKGVIVGIIDTGIDPKHPAFAGRILSIWDQTLSGAGVAAGNYGLEVSGASLTSSRDEDGHGTHVAGIAGGKHSIYGGVASEASYVIVKTDFEDAHIADGIAYIFAKARSLGRPAVVNLSLGGHADPHDGTDSLSLFIDGQTGPGRIVCCAAGNEGMDNIHAQVKVQKNKLKTVRFKVPAPADEEAVKQAFLNGWYAGSDALEVAVQGPSGITTPFQKIITSGNPARNHNTPDGKVQIVTAGPHTSNGDHRFFVAIEPRKTFSAVASGVWRLKLKGTSITNGTVDIWADDDADGLDVLFTGTSVSPTMKIGSPGTAKSAVTVASYNTKIKWKDLDGNTQIGANAVNVLSDFSSNGPLRNGAQKPDVTAPGAWLASCLSLDSQLEPEYVVAPGIRVMQGTSMATPFVSGLVALLLQRKKTLDPAGVKTLLRNNSAIPNKPAGNFDPGWGFGRINAANL